jgi:hypothetical protein
MLLARPENSCDLLLLSRSLFPSNSLSDKGSVRVLRTKRIDKLQFLRGEKND